MVNLFGKTRAMAATVAVAGALFSTQSSAVVVVGGSDGWEVSFDGNVNAFYTVGNYDANYVTEPNDVDSARVHSGYLPAFFSFNVKSPTVNGMTGGARISFAPTIHTSGSKTQFHNGLNDDGNPGISGSNIDTREVVATLSGAFGEISFGRTLSLFGRQAILSDMTLYGVGFVPGGDHFGSITFGRAGHGYTYPDFAASFIYTTPNIAGWQASIGVFDPSTISANTVSSPLIVAPINSGLGLLDEVDSPRFEVEASYSTSFANGSYKIWIDGMWQDTDSSCTGTVAVVGVGNVACGSMTTSAYGLGGKFNWQAMELVGYYHNDEGVGLMTQFSADAVAVDENGSMDAREGEGYYIQGTYMVGGNTKLGVSYGENKLENAGGNYVVGAGDIKRELWTVGVYHDVSSWLKLVAEYNRGELDTGGITPNADTLSVGGFLFW